MRKYLVLLLVNSHGVHKANDFFPALNMKCIQRKHIARHYKAIKILFTNSCFIFCYLCFISKDATPHTSLQSIKACCM